VFISPEPSQVSGISSVVIQKAVGGQGSYIVKTRLCTARSAFTPLLGATLIAISHHRSGFGAGDLVDKVGLESLPFVRGDLEGFELAKCKEVTLGSGQRLIVCLSAARRCEALSLPAY